MNDNNSPKLIIVGAGLVGCLAAQYMSYKLGFHVTVYEYRDDIRKVKNVQGKSINLALSNRGLKALENASIDVMSLLSAAIPMKGRMIHEDGKCHELLYDVKYERCIYSIGRNDLNKLLLTEVEKNVKIYFGHKVNDINLKNRTVKILKINNNTEIDVKFDYLIGCDGAFSTVRTFFYKTPLFNYSQTYIDHGYIELNIPPNEQLKSNEHKLLLNYLHIWPHSMFMMIALPNQNGSWTVTLFMPFKIFDNIKNEHELITFFQKYFLDLLPLIGEENLIRTFFSTRPQSLISVKCNRYNLESCILIMGDAAHAVVPFHGQGMNAGFEDCYILYDTLKKYGFSNGFEEFSKIRTIDGNAISDLSMNNYLEMRNSIKNKKFIWKKKIDDILYKIVPNLWSPLYVNVTFSHIPYSQCIIIENFQKKVLSTSFIFLCISFCTLFVIVYT